MSSTINWDNIEKNIIDNARSAIDENLALLKVEIDLNTPIDQGELISNTKIAKADIVGNQIKGSVYNDTSYANYVEYGVQGKTYNYHKQKRIYFVGVGARMFTRSYEKFKTLIAKNLKKSLNI